MYNKKAIEFYEKGRLAQQQGRYHSAEKLYKKAIQCDSKFPGSFNNLGNLYLEKGSLPKA
jgi:tetratricopeptide (TPR) repeat protein